MAQSPITMPALGRPFSLGMLYDCRSDQLIPGMTLWDPELLQTNVRKTAQPASDFEIIMDDSLESKSKALSVEAELKLSAYCGLCKVSGSAKYMNDTCTSLRQSRVSLQYKSTSRFEQLTMTQLGRGNVQHPHVFDDDIATHVVSGITYGADAFMVFDCTASSAEETTQLKGKLKAELDAVLAQINITGEASAKSDDKSVSSKTKCTFYSDFSSAENPVTFQEAVKLYQKLPSLCGTNGEKTVPKSVYLYPLCKLDSKGQQIVRAISGGLVHQTMETLEEMHRMRMTINDLLPHNDDGHDISMSACYRFVRLKEEIQDVIHAVTQYELSFKRQVLPILPKIRGGVLEESQLADILTLHHRSPLCAKSLLSWVQKKAREIKLLDGYIKVFKEAGIHICADDSELDEFVNDLNTTMVFALAFCINEMLDPQVRNITSSAVSGPSAHDGKSTSWFENGRQLQHLRAQIKSFTKAADEMRALQKTHTEAENEDMPKFIVCTSYKSHTNVTKMILYQEGVAEDFQWPVTPTDVTVADITPNSVCVNWKSESQSQSSCDHYLVQYRQSNLKKVQPWTSIKTTSDSRALMVNNLRPNTAYEFVVAGVTVVGFRVESGVCGPITTAPEVRVGKDIKILEGAVPEGVVKGQQIYKIVPCETVSKRDNKIMRYTIGNLRCGRHGATPRIITMEIEENAEEQFTGFLDTVTNIANGITFAADVSYHVEQKQILHSLNQQSALVEIFIFPSADSSIPFPVILASSKTKWSIPYFKRYPRCIEAANWSKGKLLVSAADVTWCGEVVYILTGGSKTPKHSIGDFRVRSNEAISSLVDVAPLHFLQYASIETILQMLPSARFDYNIDYACNKTRAVYSILLAELVIHCLKTGAKDPSTSEFAVPVPWFLPRLTNEPTVTSLESFRSCPMLHLGISSSSESQSQGNRIPECVSDFRRKTDPNGQMTMVVSAYEFGLQYTTEAVDGNWLKTKVFGTENLLWLVENRNDIIALHRSRQVRYLATLLYLRWISFELYQPFEKDVEPYMYEAAKDAELLFEQECEGNELMEETISTILPSILSRLGSEIAAAKSAPDAIPSRSIAGPDTYYLNYVRDKMEYAESNMYHNLRDNYIRCFPGAEPGLEFLIGSGPHYYEN